MQLCACFNFATQKSLLFYLSFFFAPPYDSQNSLSITCVISSILLFHRNVSGFGSTHSEFHFDCLVILSLTTECNLMNFFRHDWYLYCTKIYGNRDNNNDDQMAMARYWKMSQTRNLLTMQKTTNTTTKLVSWLVHSPNVFTRNEEKSISALFLVSPLSNKNTKCRISPIDKIRIG